MKILFVNGINTHGENNTDRLLREVAKFGYDVVDVNQKIRRFWDARWKAKEDSKAIIEIAQDGDVLVAHSYAGLKAAIANRGINFRAMFLFRPAMSRNHSFPGWQDTKVYCIHSRGDLAIWAGSALLFHPFGLAGVAGFKDPFVTNVKSRGGHNEDFEPENVGNWARFIYRELQSID